MYSVYQLSSKVLTEKKRSEISQYNRKNSQIYDQNNIFLLVNSTFFPYT